MRHSKRRNNRTTLILTDADGPESDGKFGEFAEKEKYLQVKQNILKNKLYVSLMLIILFIFDV